MAQNPMAVLAAMLGGGFQGYGQAQQRREDNANRDRLFALEYDKFKADNSLARDKFGLDSELGRGNLGLGIDELGHRRNIDFARLTADREEGAANRATSTTNTRISANGVNARQDREDAERERTGSAWLSANRGNPEAMKAVQVVFQNNPELTKRPGLAAYHAQVALANQGRMENTDARTAATDARAQGIAPRSFGSGGVAPTPQATQAPARTPAPGAVPQAAGQAPAPRPTSRAEWDQKADSLLMQGKEPEEIVALLGPRPLQ